MIREFLCTQKLWSHSLQIEGHYPSQGQYRIFPVAIFMWKFSAFSEFLLLIVMVIWDSNVSNVFWFYCCVCHCNEDLFCWYCNVMFSSRMILLGFMVLFSVCIPSVECKHSYFLLGSRLVVCAVVVVLSGLQYKIHGHHWFMTNATWVGLQVQRTLTVLFMHDVRIVILVSKSNFFLSLVS